MFKFMIGKKIEKMMLERLGILIPMTSYKQD